MASNKFSRLPNTPPPLFTGEKERDFVKQVNDEIIERVIGHQIAYFPIDRVNSNYNDLYGECIDKTYLPPIRVQVLVEYASESTSYSEYIGIDKENTIIVKFHKRRLNEDQNVEVSVGDFVYYGDRYYEIVKADTARKLFGQVDHTFEIIAMCIRSRRGLFDGS